MFWGGRGGGGAVDNVSQIQHTRMMLPIPREYGRGLDTQLARPRT